ncbi:glycosyltransferase [Streptomyces kanamyceticus]|uniref:Glycosyltransferase n=1 Tax=Streptomyces kanamyceticus TaxID=1967 RepID=A0A5J6GS49_STRKN|nr:glycosyltransferase [Streptomyces kanamyceticus]QEU97204.1 glycosyltransferase [Streptomyces kanamyceticus]
MEECQISVVVPCFNEEEVINTFHCALMWVLGETRRSFEICYVDDGSRDSTRAQLRALAAADQRVRYLSFSRNFGKEAAMLAGLRMSRGAAVALMDADLQHPPGLLHRMLELRHHGYDQVVARRDRSGEGVLRRAASSAYYRAMGRCMDVDVVDGEGDFRLLSRRAVDAVLALPEANRFSKGIFSWIGFDTVSFSYHNVSRAAGRSKWGGRRLLNYGIDGLISFNSRPLRLVIYVGLALAFAAFAYALWIAAVVVAHGAEVPGFATLLIAIVALGGIQLATLGVIGEYVGRIYGETKRRPLYVVRETDESAHRAGAVPAAGSSPPPLMGPAAVRPKVPVPGRAGLRTLRQFLVFGAIGIVNTAVYMGVYVSLNRWIPYLFAHVIGFAVSVVGSFLLNTYLTCRMRPTWQAFFRFPLSSLVNMVFSGALLFLGVHSLGTGKNITALVAGVLATPFSFLIARWAIHSGNARARQRNADRIPVSMPERPEDFLSKG